MGDLRQLVEQHAMTSKLFGVDFVPCYRSGDGEDGFEAVPAAPEVADASDTATEAVAEVKPRPVARGGSKADRLAALRERYEAEAPHAAFDTSFTNIVFGEGDPEARLMFVGEAPGADEDASGRPFVGRAGQLLEKMIVAMGLSRESVYIANVLKTRPPNNRTPTTEEVQACAPYLFEQIRIIAPSVIVTLGAPSSRLLLDSTESMGRLRGVWAEFPPSSMMLPMLDGAWDQEAVAVMPTYHPAFFLRSYTPENRKKVWSDLQRAMERLGVGVGS
ncbi:MAG: uracil-DNA glycosylase [Planctomycetota bacterium]